MLVLSSLLALSATVLVSMLDARSAEAAAGGRVPECGGGKIFLTANEKRMFDLHNRERSSRGLPVFCVDANLQAAAREHSEDMIRRDYMSHDTKGRNETFYERIQRHGYEGLPVGENYVGGNGKGGEPEAGMRWWMNSKPHRRNILDPDFDEIGIGVATGRFKSYDGWKMYTADFGGG